MRRLRADPLLRTWVVLLVLSASGTMLAQLPDFGRISGLAGTLILGLSALKARLIALHYLGLADAPAWRGAAVAIIVVTTCLLALLYLAG